MEARDRLVDLCKDFVHVIMFHFCCVYTLYLYKKMLKREKIYIYKKTNKKIKKKKLGKKMIKKKHHQQEKLNCIGSHSIATDKGHSSKYPILSVAMHKPTEMYFGEYETGFFLPNFTLLDLNVKIIRLIS